VSTPCALYLPFFASLGIAYNCSEKASGYLWPIIAQKKHKPAYEINSYRMPAISSYKTTIERSNIRDSGYLLTTSSGKLLDVFGKPLEQSYLQS